MEGAVSFPIIFPHDMISLPHARKLPAVMHLWYIQAMEVTVSSKEKNRKHSDNGGQSNEEEPFSLWNAWDGRMQSFIRPLILLLL